jgi:hypothetical protein
LTTGYPHLFLLAERHWRPAFNVEQAFQLVVKIRNHRSTQLHANLKGNFQSPEWTKSAEEQDATKRGIIPQQRAGQNIGRKASWPSHLRDRINRMNKIKKQLLTTETRRDREDKQKEQQKRLKTR